MIFKNFDADDIVRANSVEVTTGLWTGDIGSLSTIFSSSIQASGSSTGEYYWDAYNANPNTDDQAEIQFAVAYGHRLGLGAPTVIDDDNATLSTKAIYSQYKQLLLDPGDSQFTFGTVSSDQIYVINVKRSLMKQALDPGNWSLNLSGSFGSFTFIDNSEQSLGNTAGSSGLVYNVVSGSLTGPSGSTIAATSSAAGGFGLFYPSLGVIILNPEAIRTTIGMVSGGFAGAPNAPFAPVSGSSAVPTFNHAGLFNAIRLGGDFQARSAERISSTHYFVRIRNKEFNYSNNPSYFDEANGNLLHDSFINDPRSYITTIGLYNEQNELLAVAKLSRPTQKGSDSEVNLRVRLDW